MTIVNDNSRVIIKLETSLTDDARVVIYDRHMFIVQATNYYLFICSMTNSTQNNLITGIFLKNDVI